MKTKTVITLAVSLAAAAFLALPAAAQITDVTVRVDGLSCPFCAYGLEKELNALEETEEPVINVDQGVATLKPHGDKPVNFAALREAVKKAGFTPREILVEGIGHLETTVGRATLVAQDGQRLFILEDNGVLAGLNQDSLDLFEFSGTVVPQGKSDDASQPWTLALLLAKPHAKGQVN